MLSYRLVRRRLYFRKTINIYEKDMYYSLFWDLSNFSKLDLLFEQSKICEEAVNKTRRKYLKSLEELTSRCIGMIENVL